MNQAPFGDPWPYPAQYPQPVWTYQQFCDHCLCLPGEAGYHAYDRESTLPHKKCCHCGKSYYVPGTERWKAKVWAVTKDGTKHLAGVEAVCGYCAGVRPDDEIKGFGKFNPCACCGQMATVLYPQGCRYTKDIEIE